MIFEEERMSSDNAWRAWKVVDDNAMGEITEGGSRVDRASERECRVDRAIVCCCAYTKTTNRSNASIHLDTFIIMSVTPRNWAMA